PLLKSKDEVKFVIASRRDYEWAREKLRAYNLDQRCTVLFSPVFGQVAPLNLVSWIMEDRLPVRFQLQLHKVLWPPDQRGV
ncbi:MAG TPA: 7-carboxy-7-deazaguanine synthase, partial [Myxococcota bacterium]|nr:7-carboxy-7-deazaguanine synthase [Myxococcota bacterium]